MQVVRLKAQNKANVGLNPKNNTIYLSEPSGGIPYVELSNITVNDWYKNSHIKTLSGIYTGGRPTSIKVRDHYPHSIGTDWCRLSNLLTIEADTTRINTARTEEYIPITGEDNYTALKETAFWGAINTPLTVNDIEVISSMRYDTIEPYAPEEGSANYYGDRMEAVGVPMPTTPSPWYYGTIDYDEQTWEVEITLNPFTMFEGTAYQQTHNYWKPYHVTSYSVGLNYDPRLHAIEVDITSSYNGETIHGKRIYYIWHVPQAWALATKAPKVTITSGACSGPYGLHRCPGWTPTSGYDAGYTASGGTGLLELQGNDINYKNILIQLYPSVKKRYNNLSNIYSICVDSKGNYHILNSPTAYSILTKYDANRNYIRDSNINKLGSSECIYYDGYIWVGLYYIQQYNTDGVLLNSFGGYGTADGKFDSYPKLAAFNNYIYGTIPSKLQVFSSTGTYITKYLPPTGYSFRDITIDEEGNFYFRLSKTGDTTNTYIYKYDNSFNFITSWPTIYSSSVYGIYYRNGYLYVQNGTNIEKQNSVDGTIISSASITNKDNLFVDENDNIYILETSTINVLDNNYNSLYKIGDSNRNIKRNGNGIGITELSQLKKAYAVVLPNNFDPTNSGTYSKMTEYTGVDFSNITMDSNGLLEFKNLYPTETEYYIYAMFDILPDGTYNTQNSWLSKDTGTYCPSGTVGNRRNYRWFTRYPSCSQIPAGSATQYCNQLYSFDTYMTDGRSIIVSLDDFESGTDLDTATILYYWFNWLRVHLWTNGSDGGRTKFWVTYSDDGVKKNYNNINDACNMLSMGMPVRIYYRNENYFLYNGVTINSGWNLGTINLINRTIKNGAYLTTGFGESHNVERISS